MVWDYRIIFQNGQFATHEVFYDESKQIISWTEEAICPHGETLEEFQSDFKHYQAALLLSVLTPKPNSEELIELAQANIAPESEF